MADEKEKVFDQVNVEKPRNENLTGGKSTQVHEDEAKIDQKTSEQRTPKADRQPAETKATADLLPQDAEKKGECSAEESTG